MAHSMWGLAVSAVVSFGVGYYLNGCLRGDTDKKRKEAVADVSRKRLLDGHAGVIAYATIPIPVEWSKYNPETREGQIEIATLLINHSEHSAAHAFVRDLAVAMECCTASQFDEHLSEPLSKEKANSSLVWLRTIPLVWSWLDN